jgi:dihydroxyacetone kinase
VPVANLGVDACLELSTVSSAVVGDGMLAASVSGDIFGSPSAKQVLGAVKSVPSDAGSILVVTNYTGEKQHEVMECDNERS